MEMPKNIKVSDAIVKIPLATLIPYQRNNKKHPQDQINKIKQSIENFGFRNPIVIDSEYNVIAGHGRMIAAKQLNMSYVPCIIVDNLTEDQIKAFRIMDNKSTESEFDFDALKLEFTTLEKAGYDLDLTGFSFDEIVEITADVVLSEKEAFGNLPSGEKSKFEQITFTLEESQANKIRELLEMVKESDIYKEGIILNSNTNGTAIWAICKEWEKQRN